MYTESTVGVMVSLLWDTASGGDAEGDELNSIENLSGSGYDDSLFGDNNANFLNGNDGNDTLLGFGGDDILYGDGRSLGGNDVLNGGAGHDTLNGGPGGDTMAGELDADIFVWHSTNEGAALTSAGVDSANLDVILDLNPAKGNKIDVRSIDAGEGLRRTGFHFRRGILHGRWVHRCRAGGLLFRRRRYLPLVQHRYSL